MDSILAKSAQEILSELEATTFCGSDVILRHVWDILDDVRNEVRLQLADKASESLITQLDAGLQEYFVRVYGRPATEVKEAE